MKQDYITRLSRAARWRLPRGEAEEVIADYRDIVGAPPRRSERELLRDLGRPWDVVKPLARPWEYRVWLAVFAALTALILVPGVSPFGPFYRLWSFCFANGRYGRVLALFGAAGALMWFRWKGRKGLRFPKALSVMLTVLTAWTGGLLLLDRAWMGDPDFLWMWGGVQSWIGPDRTVPLLGEVILRVFQYGGFAMALIGVYALVKARTEDRRWAAVYILGMAAMLVSMESLRIQTSMDPELHLLMEDWWSHYRCCLAIAAGGLAGTGAALC